MIKNYVKLILSLVFVSNVMAQNVPNYVPKNGLVGWWPFNGNANDESGNGNNGTVNGATLTADRKGKANSAYDFDGKSYVLVDNINEKLQIEGDFSFSIWANIDVQEGNTQSLLVKGNNSTNEYSLQSYGDKTLHFDRQGLQTLSNFSYGQFYNKWTNITCVLNNTTASLYVNGIFISSNILKFPISKSSLPLVFGVFYDNQPNFTYATKGQLDDIAIYNRALTQQEITALYTGTPVAQNIPSYVPTNGLVGYWPFNGNANDESGNGNNGTVNGATLTTDRNGKANSAYSFDGKSSNIIVNNSSSLTISKSITVGIWVKHNSPGSEILFRKGGSYTPSWSLNQEGRFLFYVHIGGWTNSGGGSTIPESNKWYFVVGTYDGFECNLYVNGKLEASNKLSGEFSLTNDLLYFGTDAKNNQWLNGNLSNGFIYNRALTQQEISALYNGSNQSALASTKVFVDAPATVNQNQEVELSISTEALNTSDNVIAYQTDLSYDATRYTFVGSNLTGTLNPNGSVDINTSNNGLLKIGYMSQTALNGAGSLVKLKFKANNTLGQGIFGLSNFLYNTVAISSLKSDTINTIDVTPPTARITYSQNPVRKGDSLLITVNFNEKMAVSPVPQLNLSGQNTLPNTNLTKVDDTTYTFWWVVEKGNGDVNVTLATGQDLGGNVIVATPTQNANFKVLPTVFGDIDTNTLVQAYDAALALQFSVGLNPLPTMDPLPWSNWRIAVANVDTVGNVTANDASLILQKSIGKIATFPADAKKRGGDAPVANVTVTQEGSQLVFRTTGTLYAFNVFMKDNFNVLGQPDVKNKGAMLATNINATTYNVGLASTTPFIENEPFLVIPILTNENVQGTMDIVANSQERSLSYGKAAGITAINKEAVIVYPNPTKDIVTINNAEGNTLRIVDAQGKQVYNQKVNASSMEVSMKAIATRGTYVLHILDSNNESVQTKQIVLE